MIKGNYIFENAIDDICDKCKIGIERREMGEYACFSEYGEFCPARKQIENVEKICTALLDMVYDIAKTAKMFEPDDAKDLAELYRIARDDYKGTPEAEHERNLFRR